MESAAARCPLVLALDSMAMAEHAFALGLLTEEALRAVSDDYESDVAQEDGRAQEAGLSSRT